ncbi:MAG TPA: hypothetical protein VNV18_07215 [Stellaceae bacterium]|jgi:hypothetical protein|nr:hypothetical protein [Stellaceae bacterium]
MIRLSTLFWLVVVSTAGFAMFAVKYQVQSLADELARTVQKTADAERDLRVLDAEWAYLNRPDALAQLNERLLSLVPIATKQLRANVADIPMRPAPPPPPPPPPPPVAIETVAAVAPAIVAPPPDALPVEDGAMPLDVAGPPAQPTESAPPAPHEPRMPVEPKRPVVTVALETHGAAQLTRPSPVRSAARATSQHRAGSLDELIAQIAESR